MMFNLETARGVYAVDDKDISMLQALGFVFEPLYNHPGELITKSATKEIATLEELMEFCRASGSDIVIAPSDDNRSLPTITIYNGYLE